MSDIQGRVVDGDSGQPVCDASVSIVSGPSPSPDIAALTDEEGRFALSGLGPGRWRMHARGPNGSEGDAEVELPNSHEIELAVYTDTSTPEQG